MDEINYIKYLVNDEGKSINAVAEMLNRDWRTINKYATQSPLDWSKEKEDKPRKGMLYDKNYDWGETLDMWLEEDAGQKTHKLRRTAKYLYKQLVEEKGFSGSYETVAAYVKKWKEINGNSSKPSGYEELEHEYGEA